MKPVRRSWNRNGLALVILAGGIAFVAAAGVYFVQTAPIRLEAGSMSWGRVIQGATHRGIVHERAVVRIPGLDRSSEDQYLTLTTSGASTLGVSVDGDPLHWVRTSSTGSVALSLKKKAAPGLRVDLRRAEDAPPLELVSLRIGGTRQASVLGPLIAAFLVGALAAILGRQGRPPILSNALGLVMAGFLTLFSLPAMVFVTLPDAASVLRLLVPFILAGAGAGLVWRLDVSSRRFFWRGTLLIFAGLFGAWIRLYFLPAPGSWDMEYWRAWGTQASSKGLSQVYGDPTTVPEGHFLPQLLGEEPSWNLEFQKRQFAVDYPPLAMALFRYSLPLVTNLMSHGELGEIQNVALKLPAVMGDVGAVLLLLWFFRKRPYRGAGLAALYWIVPFSWLSSAVLGFQDGAYAPMAVAAVILAGAGRSVLAGGLFALACLIKPLALIVAPAVLTALLANKVGWRGLAKAVTTGLIATFVVVLPWLVGGTAAPMAVHVFRAFFHPEAGALVRPGNLSSGFANLWWICGYVLAVMKDPRVGTLTEVPIVVMATVPFPAATIGTFLVAVGTVCIIWWQRRYPGSPHGALAAAAVFFTYCMVWVGVYENHPHLVFLFLLATGLASTRLRTLFALAAASYSINLLMFSGLGRYYGTRYMVLEPLLSWVSSLRMAVGIDLTLPLAVINTVVFVWLLILAKKEHSRLDCRFALPSPTTGCLGCHGSRERSR